MTSGFPAVIQNTRASYTHQICFKPTGVRAFLQLGFCNTKILLLARHIVLGVLLETYY